MAEAVRTVVVLVLAVVAASVRGGKVELDGLVFIVGGLLEVRGGEETERYINIFQH